MRTLIAVCGLALAAAASPALAADDNTLTAAEKQAGWKLLFDGKSTDGWRNYKKTDIGAGWKVVDGALSREEKGAGDIITADQYGAFELSLDFKIAPEGNSGVMYRVRETENSPWQTGPEIQIQDNNRGHDPQKCGWLYQFYKTDTDATKPAGQWNTLNILITPEKCVHTMNGVKYVEYVIGSQDWNEKLAASKFAKYSNFGKFETGHICLQDHGNPVSYKNIKIRPIAEKKSASTTTVAAAPKATVAAAAAEAPKATAKAPAKATVKAEVKTEAKSETKPKPAATAQTAAPPPSSAASKPAASKPAIKAEAPAATETTTATAENAAEPAAPAAGTTRTYTTSRPTIRGRVRRIIDRITP
jgi:hypothetical protein